MNLENLEGMEMLPEKRVMFRRVMWSGGGIYSNYRIPGLCVSACGTLFAYCEARRASSDWARMDILLFRSTDGGVSFSDPVVMAAGTDELPTVNNPVMIAEPCGRLHFLYCVNYAVSGGGVFRRVSEDDGLSWSEPIDVTPATRPDERNVFALGPGHGVCLAGGRLLVPVWLVLKSAGIPVCEHGPSVVSTLYSDDHGLTWQMGDILPSSDAVPSPSETAAADLWDGQVYLNIRAAGIGCRARAWLWRADGASGWTVPEPDPALVDPGCFGSVIGTPDGSLLCLHCADASERRRLAVQFSRDNGLSWSKPLVLEPDGAGYADLALLPDGSLCVLYEQDWGTSETLLRLRL